MIGHRALCELIPHAGTMCLLASVEHWDSECITCTAISHRAPDNPLRRDGRLSAVHAIEYAAQAMAVHGALRSAGNWEGSVAYLVAVRDVEWHTPWLDEVTAELRISATELLAAETSLVYAFEVHAAAALLAAGRVTVMKGRQGELQ